MRHFNRRATQQQRRLVKQVQKVDANHFFNLLTGPQLLEMVEAQLPEHRELELTRFRGHLNILVEEVSVNGKDEKTVSAGVSAADG